MNTAIAPFKALHVGTQNTTAKEPQRTQISLVPRLSPARDVDA